MDNINEYFRHQVKRHEKTRKPGTSRDFIDMYLEQLDTGFSEISGEIEREKERERERCLLLHWIFSNHLNIKKCNKKQSCNHDASKD